LAKEYCPSSPAWASWLGDWSCRASFTLAPATAVPFGSTIVPWILPGTGESPGCALGETCAVWARAGSAQSRAINVSRTRNTGPREELQNIPPVDFLQGTILVEITAIILQPSRWLPASFHRSTPLPARATPDWIEIFWRTARLSEYSAMGLEPVGCHRRNLGLPGRGP
jgi:hypothetical protein